MNHWSRISTPRKEFFIILKLGPEKNFGYLFSAIFVIIGVYPLFSKEDVRWWSLFFAGILLLITLVRPSLFAKPNYYWFRFGIFISSVTVPIIMCLVYVVTFVPLGFIMKAIGKDLLETRIDKKASSYWIKRDIPMQSMKKQF